VPTPPPGRGRGEDWRSSLKSPRWRVAALRNSEMNLTFGLLVWGYGTHFWH
jgi:hypothetical protein